jgi:hypothetical protein
MLYLTDRLDSIARMSGGRLISILGNHEMMNVIGEFAYVSPTSTQHIDLQLRKDMFKPGGTIAQKLAKRNMVVRIGHHLFCHGGILPHHIDATNNQIQVINDVTRKFLQNMPLTIYESTMLAKCVFDSQSICWTRSYVEMLQANKDLFEQIIDAVLSTTQCKHIFVGHNTVQNIAFILNGKVVFTDVGLSRAYPEGPLQFIEISNIGLPNETIAIVQVNKST